MDLLFARRHALSVRWEHFGDRSQAPRGTLRAPRRNGDFRPIRGGETRFRRLAGEKLIQSAGFFRILLDTISSET
jgi:hypothetical protein